MKYMGSKARYAKEILPIILKDRKENQAYVEPFVGGANTLHLVDGERYANDKNEYLIELLKAVSEGWTPPEYISEQQYKEVRENKDKYPKHLVGFVGIGCSYSGKWFGGFARNIRKDAPNAEILNKTTRNYCAESQRNILKQAEGLKGVWFQSDDYDKMLIPDNSIIYCDPPYKGTTKYKDDFDHDAFWDWCEDKVFDGHTVFVSEYNAPDGWKCVWQKEVNNSLTKNTGAKKGIEKLFTKTL